jgi:acyl carrier protein
VPRREIVFLHAAHARREPAHLPKNPLDGADSCKSPSGGIMVEARDLTAEVKRIVAHQLADKLKVPESEIGLDATFAELGADSMHRVELVLAFEEAFNIEIPADDMEQIRSVRDVIQYLQKRLPA